MRVTYLGHAGFLIEIKGKCLVFDPFVTPNDLAKDIIDVNQIKADYVLLSHGHEDHVADAEVILKNNNATVISNFEVVSWFQGKKGVEKGHPMNFGGAWDFDFGRLKYVKAVHSSVLPDGTYGGNPGGFVIDSDCNFYYAGDTALTMDMQLIGRQHRLDVAFLPIGDNFTMGVDDAILATEFINCKTIVGMHFDTFGYIKIDHALAKEKFKNAGLKLILPTVGKPFEL